MKEGMRKAQKSSLFTYSLLQQHNQSRKEELGPKGNKLIERREKKVIKLIESCRPKEVPNKFEDIVIGVEALKEKFVDETRGPAAYGGIIVT